MVEIGYFLSSEEHGPNELLRQAKLAENAGLESVWISDHFHPWVDDQGESPFVWSVIGGIAATTDLRVTTAVTCPTMRTHPAIIAHAAATSALMLDGRFELGLGSGEALNEHIFGDRWPAADERLEMLEEAIEVIRLLFSGDEVSHQGRHYTLENARLYSMPSQPPPIVVSGFGPKATKLAARIADGYVNTKPDKELVDLYRQEGGKGDATAGLKVCWADNKEEAMKLAHKLWRSSGVPGELSQELRTPALFDQAAQLVTPESLAEKVPCGPDPEPIIKAAKEYVEAGFDRIYISQMGPEQDAFFTFFEKELLPELNKL